MESTLVLFKPDIVEQTQSVSSICGRFQLAKLSILALNIQKASRHIILEHFNKSDEWKIKCGQRFIERQLAVGKKSTASPLECGELIIERNVSYMTSNYLMAMLLRGEDSIGRVKDMVGETEPISSGLGTIRRMYSIDSFRQADAEERAIRNVIHCSNSPEEAKREIQLWFPNHK